MDLGHKIASKIFTSQSIYSRVYLAWTYNCDVTVMRSCEIDN